MSIREDILFPIGRLVQGSLYEPQTTDAENKPLTYRQGEKAGQPRVKYYFAIAIEKGPESHWHQTPWGAVILQAAKTGFPQGQWNSPHFAWKVEDGDSQVPNKAGNKPCDREGFPGHWVVKLSSSFAPQIFNENATMPLVEKDHIKLGDYIQVYGSVSSNDASQQPGVFINFQHVAFMGYGQRIIVGIDPKKIAWGQGPKPAGMSATPLSNGAFTPQPTAPMTPPQAAPMTPPPVATPAPTMTPPPAPYPELLQPPVGPKMTALAQGTYEQYKQAGWTDEQLIQQGLMSA